MFDLRDLYSIVIPSFLISIFVTRYGVDWTRYILSVISQHYEYPELSTAFSRDQVQDHDVASRGLWMRRAGSLWHKRAGASNSSDLSSTSRWRTLKGAGFIHSTRQESSPLFGPIPDFCRSELNESFPFTTTSCT